MSNVEAKYKGLRNKDSLMEEKKDTSATEAASTDTEGSVLENLENNEAPESAVSVDEAVEASQPIEEGESGETFGEADILSEPDGVAGGSQIVNEMEQQILSLNARLEDQDSQYKRIAADFENFRRRTQKEKSDLENQVKCTTITELLPVIDNFERARSQIKPQTDAEMNIHKSYQGVYKQLVDCLKRVGVSPMRSEGEVFDPNLHEAVMREPTSEYEDGVIIEDLMRGYMLGDRVLRHAMVKVAAATESSPSVDEESSTEDGGES